MVFCVVPGCSSKSNKRTYRSGIMLHTFPRSLERIRLWLRQVVPALGDIQDLAEKVLNGKRTDVYRICSQHFTPDCYVIRKKLKAGSTPTIFSTSTAPPTGRNEGVSPEHLYTGLGKGSPSHEEQNLFPPLLPSVGKKQEHVTDSILKLSLEILYLLTGEIYGPIKKNCNDNITHRNSPQLSGGRGRRSKKSTMELPPPSLTPEKSKEKILEATNKITELLTGEVPIRCQDVAVYLSMEEREYLEGHCDRYKAAMMEEEPHLTSADGSRKRNHPKRRRRPHFSQNSAQEERDEIQYQDPNLARTNVKKEEEKTVRKEEKMSSEIGSDPGDTAETQRDINVKEEMLKIKEEESPLEISADGQYRNYNIRNYSCTSEDGDITYGDITPHTSEESSVIANSYMGLSSADLLTGRGPPDCFEPATRPSFYEDHNVLPRSVHDKPLTPDATHQKGVLPFTCSDCGKSFKCKSNLFVHAQMHVEKKTYSCSKCGKTFLQNCDLVIHDRVHTGDYPFWCSECGKGFSYRSGLLSHARVHTGEKPYPCSDCGKSFREKSILFQHRKIHTEEKPYSCSECGKGFSQKASLIAHDRMHTGERPYSCAVCGKSFHMKSILLQHERIHTRAKPYSCSECGKGFTQNSDLIKHREIHARGEAYPCSQCGECYATQPALAKHQLTHTRDNPYSCYQCGARFMDRTARDRHAHISHVIQSTSFHLQ